MTNSAELCRKNGWNVGDTLVGDDGFGPTMIELTAIGRCNVLAVEISHDGKATRSYEMTWPLLSRDWTKVPKRGTK